MASTYVNDLRLNEMATGDESGNWGVVTNLNLELIGEALSFGTEAITTNADTHTTTVADGAADPGRAMYLKYTGTLDSACTITIAPNTISRMHFIENGTTGSQNIIISQGTGANITIPAGDTKAVYLDGAGSGAAVVDAFASLSTVDLKVQDDLTVTDDVSIGGALTLTGNGDFNGDLDVDGTTNLDVVDIDGAVDMASTLQVDGAITSSAGATITLADNTDNLTLTTTDADASVGPNLRMYRNSGSPADNDLVGAIDFEGRNDNSQDVVYSQIFTQILDASDGTEDGYLSFKVMNAGTSRQRLLFDAGETVFNDESEDVDFRVESNGNANMLFVDAGNDVVTIGGATVESGDHLEVISTDATTNLRIRNTHADAAGAQLIFDKTSASPADNDVLGLLMFLGNDSAGNAHQYAQIKGISNDVTNGTEDGTLTLNVSFGGTMQERIRLQGDSNHITITGKDNDSNQIKFVDYGGTIDGYIYTENTEIGFLDADGSWTIQAKNDTSIFFAVNGSEAARFDSSGNFMVGITSSSHAFMVNQATVNEIGGFFYNNTSTNAACVKILQDGAGSSGPALVVRQDGSGNAITVDDGSDGNTVFSVSQNGGLSKASGSFKINHPLEAKKDTHHLVHSFVEAPQADNIYRGTATLSSGTATINLDTVSGMTEGTYVLLNTNTSCFTSNETDWDAVKGSVTGNILTITCQNDSSTATVSWLVIGERHDQHMKDTDWTDDNGKVIVEPLKEG